MTIVFNMIGVFVTDKVEKDWGPDPSRVVIDEIVGMWIAVLWIPPTLMNWGIAFVLFAFLILPNHWGLGTGINSGRLGSNAG